MKKIVGFAKRFGFSGLVLVLPALAHATSLAATPAPAAGAQGVPFAPISGVQEVLNFLCTIYGWLFYFLMALVVIFIVLGAYRYLTSAGEAEKVKSAQNTLLYAAIAVAVALLAWGIPHIVANFIGAVDFNTC